MIFGVSYKYYWIDFERDYDGKRLPNLMPNLIFFLYFQISKPNQTKYVPIKLPREIYTVSIQLTLAPH